MVSLDCLPRWLSGQESACQCRRHRRPRADPSVGKSPWSRKWQPTPVFPPREPCAPHFLSPFPKRGDRLAASVPRTADPEQVLLGGGDLRGSADSSDRQMGVQTAVLLASSQWRLGTLRGTLQGPERPPPQQRTQPPNKPRLEPRSSNRPGTPEFLPGYLKVRTRFLTQRRLSPFPRLLLSQACGGPSWGLGRQQRRPWEPSFSGSR